MFCFNLLFTTGTCKCGEFKLEQQRFWHDIAEPIFRGSIQQHQTHFRV